jgi:hypothetical protein
MGQRKYLPTLAELVDRLSIARLKSIFIPDHKDAYEQEISDIKHDINIILNEKNLKLDANDLHAVQIIMLSNRYIWENESKIRNEGNDTKQEKLLRLTHSINGVRNNAKNVLSQKLGERIDLKTDCLAADLIVEFGNWNINY